MPKKNYERNILYYLEGNSFMAQYIDIFNENNEINFYTSIDQIKIIHIKRLIK